MRAWLGEGLPRLLEPRVVATPATVGEDSPEIAFVEVLSVTTQGRAALDVPTPQLACPVVGLSACGLDDLASVIRVGTSEGLRIERLICPVAVFDFTPNGVRVREIRHGLTAVDLQMRLPVTLWSGPDLKELGTH